jgi:DNA-binding CsgD family transcriptional regulator
MDAIRLLQDVQSKRIDPATLDTEQRRACLMVMANGKQSLAEIAHVLGVQRSTISADLKVIRKRLGAEVKGYSLEVVLGQLVHCAEKYTAQAMRQEDVGLAWTIQKDLVRTLKELGLLSSQGATDGLRVTIEAMGSGYERARDALSRALDPALTGEVIDVESKAIVDKSGDTSAHPPGMPLPQVRPDAPARSPGVVVERGVIRRGEVIAPSTGRVIDDPDEPGDEDDDG